MFSKITIVLVLSLLTWWIIPTHPVTASGVVLTNLASVQTTGFTLNDPSDLVRGVGILPPNDGVAYRIDGITMRFDCQNPTLSDDCEITVNMAHTNGNVTVAVVVDNLKPLTLSIPISDEVSTGVGVTIQLQNSGDILVVYEATNAPTGHFTYVETLFCNPTCTTGSQHLAFELVASALNLPTPSLNAPIHKAHTTDTTPTFVWSDSGVSTIQSARLMVYTEDRSFEFKKVVTGGVENYTLTSVQSLAVGKYLWRVRYRHDPTVSFGDFSTRNTLFID